MLSNSNYLLYFKGKASGHIIKEKNSNKTQLVTTINTQKKGRTKALPFLLKSIL